MARYSDYSDYSDCSGDDLYDDNNEDEIVQTTNNMKKEASILAESALITIEETSENSRKVSEMMQKYFMLLNPNAYSIENNTSEKLSKNTNSIKRK